MIILANLLRRGFLILKAVMMISATGLKRRLTSFIAKWGLMRFARAANLRVPIIDRYSKNRPKISLTIDKTDDL